MAKKILFVQLTLLLVNFILSDLQKLLKNPYLVGLLILGAVVGLWGLLSFNLRSFSIFPQPKENNKLTTRGIYKYIRHPMYSGLLIIGLSLLLSSITSLSVIIYIFLIAVLDLKATLEERMLTRIHKEYNEYIKNTYRFVPYLY